MSVSATEELRETPLAALHRELAARMVPFAGYSMPVQYPTGIIAEHNQVRSAAGLFDVSHMGQAVLVGPDHETTARALEALTPGDFLGLGRGRERYTLLLTEGGGIIDDMMVTRPADPAGDGTLMLVVNAARKEIDYADLRARLPASVRLEPMEDRALLALQGPQAASVMGRHIADLDQPGFMTARPAQFDGIPVDIFRSGYTGEDGFEISLAADEGRAGRPGAPCRARGEADRPRCAGFAPARGRPLPLRPRHRRHDDAGRGRPYVRRPEAAAGGGRLPRREPHLAADR